MTSWALQLSKVLVASPSRVLSELLARLLCCHAATVLTAATLAEALDHLAENDDLSLVLVELLLPDGDGLRLLERVRELEDPKPRVILVSGRSDPAHERRGAELGAVGFLTKPICFRDIAGALRGATQPLDSRALRRRTSGRAFVIEPTRSDHERERSELFWYIRDLGPTGAFLETESPLPVGSALDLSIDVGTAEVRVVAEVVRVQQPSWSHSGGVGVRFVGLGAEETALLRRHVDEAGGARY